MILKYLKKKIINQLLDDFFNQFTEWVIRILGMYVLDELGDYFRVSVRLEFVALILEVSLNVLVVGDDSLNNHFQEIR